MEFASIPTKPKEKIIVSFTTNGKIAGHINFAHEVNQYRFTPSFEAHMTSSELLQVVEQLNKINKQD